MEFYSNSTADPSGHGQGQTFLGRLSVPTDASGNFNFTAIVAAPPVGQTVFSATATDASGNTSEFSADFQAPTQMATYLNGQAGDNTAATFIHNLYRETLGREPEAADQAFWVNAYNQALSKGTAAGAQQTVVADFLASVEYRTHLVIAAYHDFLHRAPEAGGLQFWLARLDDGLDESVLLAEFVGGDEYFNDAGGNAAGWVNALYHDLLGRTSEAGGLAYWEQQDQPSSGQPANRVTISREFLSAPETEHKLLNADYPGTASLGAPGTAAVGAFDLADITGDGWDNLYFQGKLSTAAVDALFAKLQAGASDDSVDAGMLDMDEYFAG